jgi:hypothetical protein
MQRQEELTFEQMLAELISAGVDIEWIEWCSYEELQKIYEAWKQKS